MSDFFRPINELAHIMKKSKDFNHNQLLTNARMFFKSFERCMGDFKTAQNMNNVLLIPAIVNLSLSLELYVKYVLRKQGKTITTHDLNELFKHLRTKTVTEIESMVYVPMLFNFPKLIDIHSKVFTEWRYNHHLKTKQVNMQFLNELCLALEQIIQRDYS